MPVISGTMKVALTITSALAVALVAAPLTDSPAHAATAARRVVKPRALYAPAAPFEARLISCRRSPRTEGRTAVVGASMSPVPGSKRLALRVELQQRPLSGGRWALRSDVPGLGVWMAPSDPSIGSRPNDVYKYRQAVGRLTVPFAYRFRVGFRWLDGAGRVVREESTTTQPCREPDLRPDLVVESVRVDPGADPESSAYTVVVRNAGRSWAGSIGVAATFSAPARYIRGLAPSESGEVRFTGPACRAGEPGPTFLADPANAIDEARETNNSLVVTCPAEP